MSGKLGIMGRKLGMTSLVQDDGRVIPVTVIDCPPSTVVQIKTADKDGYPALVLGFEALKKPTKTKKYRFLREFRTENPESFKVGDQVTVETFKEVTEVVITATSKGKGFAGFIKRHHFSSGPGSHGSHHHREPGSVGARAKPGRIHKGKRMAGRMGNEQVTNPHAKLVEVHAEQHLLLIKGQVPGPKGGLVLVKA